MSFLTWHADRVGLSCDRLVLPAAEVAPLQDALALLARMEGMMAAQAAQVEAAEAAGHAAGWAQGLQEARQQMQAERADVLAQLARDAQAQRERDQQAVAQLAIEVARQLLGSVPPADRLAALALQAARELLPARCWRLAVHGSQVTAVHERLALLDPHNRTGLAAAEVLADADLGPDACRLETDLGSAVARVDEHLDRLARAWRLTSPAPEALA